MILIVIQLIKNRMVALRDRSFLRVQYKQQSLFSLVLLKQIIKGFFDKYVQGNTLIHCQVLYLFDDLHIHPCAELLPGYF